VTSPPPTLQARTAAIAPLKRRGEQLLGRLLRRSSAVVPPRGELNGGDPFLEVGRRLRLARESRGLSLRQLAQETRISITVLEALEKGWRDRLPEPAYLRTMLGLLEAHLALERGSLEAVLPARITHRMRSSLPSHAERVSLTSIALFATWQGALLYALLCLLLIYGLNRQQQRLLVQGLLPLRTVAARPSPTSETSNAGARERAMVLAAYPDLRPLERARLSQGLAVLRRQNPGQKSVPASGRGADGEAQGGRPTAQDAVPPAPRP
jgi:transcriptional regulator with XRE-family HTH domain